MRHLLCAFVLIVAGACRDSAPQSYLFVWAGDSARKANDFLGVIDADPQSSKYGSVVASIPTGETGTHPHHTEAEMPANGHLLANGFGAGRTWLFDLTKPLEPKILTSFGDVDGYSHPHTFVRLANGNVLATYQYRGAATVMSHGAAGHDSAGSATEHVAGGLVEIDERGTLVRSGSALDTVATKFLYPYSVLPMPAFDLAVSTTTDMDEANVKATSEWLQLWRLSDLTLKRSIALKPGPRGDENHFSGEPRLLPDGKSVYIHTFNCGLYLVRDLDRDEPATSFIKGFEGKNCGVPVLTGHWWLQTVPETHSVVVLDITNPEQPREVSRVAAGDDESPHWLALDPTGRRVVMNSSGGKGNRLFVLNFDPATGALSIDERFRDANASSPGVSLTGKTWPHGFTGTATPHGTVFSR